VGSVVFGACVWPSGVGGGDCNRYHLEVSLLVSAAAAFNAFARFAFFPCYCLLPGGRLSPVKLQWVWWLMLCVVLVVGCRGHGHPLAPQRSGLARAQSAALPHNWGYDDDALLAALVVEYNFNWHFIADTCSSTCALQVGIASVWWQC